MSTDSCCIVVAQHHCRSCGQLFCGTCSSKRLILPHKEVVNDFKGKVRVCTACFDQLCILYPPEAVNATSSSAMPAMIPLVESARTSSKILLLGGKVIDLYSQSTSSMGLNSDPCVLCACLSFRQAVKVGLCNDSWNSNKSTKNLIMITTTRTSIKVALLLNMLGTCQHLGMCNQINQPTQPTNSTNQINSAYFVCILRV
jgi:hypothetical protein